MTTSSQANKWTRFFFNEREEDMKIFSKDLIKLNYYALDKKSCLEEMVEFLFENEVIFSRERFFDSILTREKMMSTGIGKKLAIPHARSEAVKELTIAVYLLQNELEFDAIDDEPVKIILMIAVPENMKEKYMLVLSAISNFFQDIENYRKLLNCNSNEEAVNLLRTIERKI